MIVGLCPPRFNHLRIVERSSQPLNARTILLLCPMGIVNGAWTHKVSRIFLGENHALFSRLKIRDRSRELILGGLIPGDSI